jgi:hypothetical protein
MHLPTLASTLLLSRAEDRSKWPDYSKDKIPPYPSMTNADGSNLTIDNIRGTRLYGWKGCEPDESKAIAAAFDDFHKLADPLASKIDWADDPALDFWGKNEGKDKVPDDRRKQIQQIFQAQQQMYARGWAFYPPNYWQSLWIEVSWLSLTKSLDSFAHCQYRSVAVVETRRVILRTSARTRSPTTENAVAANPP